MSGQSPNPSTVTERLADRLARPVAPEDRKRAAKHVLDWTGCAIAGARAPAAAAMARALGQDCSKRDVRFLGALGNILEMDDVDKRALLHPGPVVAPAALSVAVDCGATGGAFLDAIVRGYEATIRIGRAVGPDHYRYWHNTATCGPFGAAAAAASLFALDVETTVWALGLAGTQASGFWQTRHEPASFAKQLHTARAADAGVFSARLARADFVGLKTVLEGPQGFFAAMCANASADDVVSFEESDAWVIHDVSFKPWPACRHAHAAIDAALALRSARKDWKQAASIIVRTYKDAILFCDKPAPMDTLSAKFSLQHAVAVALLRGEPTLRDFDDASLDDPQIQALRDKISVKEDSAFSRAYPARFGAALDVALPGEGSLSIETPDALGDPENPASDNTITTKAEMLMQAGGIKSSSAARLIEATLSLPDSDTAFEDYTRILFDEALT